MVYNSTLTGIASINPEARLALLALQYMERTQVADITPREYALKYQSVYREMRETLPPKL